MFIENFKISEDVEKRDRNYAISINCDLGLSPDIVVVAHREVIAIKDGKKFLWAGEKRYDVGKALSEIKDVVVTLPDEYGGLKLTVGQLAVGIEMVTDILAKQVSEVPVVPDPEVPI
jgi:hypothetical protein